MNQEEIEALAEKWEKRAESAMLRYQESGLQRHLREKENADDLAEALRIAAFAKEDHDELISLRGALAELGAKATYVEGEAAGELVKEVAAYARVYGLIPPLKEGTR